MCCPNTGLNVQDWSAEEGPADDDNAYEAMTCLACHQIYLVNPIGGRVLSATKIGEANYGQKPICRFRC
jgi:hypothetical protein